MSKRVTCSSARSQRDGGLHVVDRGREDVRRGEAVVHRERHVAGRREPLADRAPRDVGLVAARPAAAVHDDDRGARGLLRILQLGPAAVPVVAVGAARVLHRLVVLALREAGIQQQRLLGGAAVGDVLDDRDVGQGRELGIDRDDLGRDLVGVRAGRRASREGGESERERADERQDARRACAHEAES